MFRNARNSECGEIANNSTPNARERQEGFLAEGEFDEISGERDEIAK